MARINPSLKSSPVRKKQLMMAGGGAAVIAGLALAAAWFADSGSSRTQQIAVEKPEQINVNLPLPGQQLSDKDVWRANEASKIEALNREINTLKLNMQDNMKRQDSEAGLTEVPMPPPPPPPPASALRQLQPMAGSMARQSGQTLGTPPAMPGEASSQPQQVVKRAFSLDVSDSSLTSGTGRQVDMASTNTAADKSADRESKPVQTAENYLPAGTFMRAVLLAGLDAPTGGQAQNNPHPVLLRVIDPAQLPNQYLANMKDCVLTANGYGDISSERAYVRMDRLSCIDTKGGAIDVAIKGYVAGEDGKAGMRGRLVTKQGQALANAFLAGIGSGIGQAFQQSASTTSVSPLGSTTTVTDGKELQAGVSSGIGSAMQQLSKYYIKLAEQIFPVIEVDGGRVVDVILTRGMSIERQ